MGKKKRAVLPQNELNSDVARFITNQSNLSRNKAGCEKLLQKVENSLA